MRRGLRPYLEGARVDRVEVLDSRLVAPERPDVVEKRLRGTRISAVHRRGKYLVFELDSGDVVLHHLRMTGSFATRGSAAEDPVTHVRARYHLNGGVVVYRDPRRFGTMHVLTASQAREYLDARLGPEPLEPGFDAQTLYDALRRRRGPLKAVLLDQRVVAGLGNIYVDEALFLARLHPQLPANEVTRPASARLRNAIVARLEEAVDAGGSTLRDYRGVEGDVGGMQERFFVYGHAGEPCRTCGRSLSGGRVAGRGTTWCAHCQRRRQRSRG